MYICLCKGVTERQIRREVCAGGCTLRELSTRLGVAINCGRCACEVQRVLQETLIADLCQDNEQAA